MEGRLMLEKKALMEDRHLKFMTEKIQPKYVTKIKDGGFFGGELAKMGSWK
jgi:hypothetical protein